MSGRGFARRVTARNVDAFAPLLKSSRASGSSVGGGDSRTDDRDFDEANDSSLEDVARAAAESLFAGTRFTAKRQFRRRPARNRTTSSSGASNQQRSIEATDARSRTTEPTATQPNLSDDPVALGPLLWMRTNLPPSSVQRQQGHPTYGLRLVKAGFTLTSGFIDQTTYFRYVAFGSLHWTIGSTDPVREDAEADFAVTLLGMSFGTLRLRISHKPSGAAGQGNYTTMLHWSDLADTLRTTIDLRKKRVRIYGPATSGAPYTLIVD